MLLHRSKISDNGTAGPSYPTSSITMIRKPQCRRKQHTVASRVRREKIPIVVQSCVFNLTSPLPAVLTLLLFSTFNVLVLGLRKCSTILLSEYSWEDAPVSKHQLSRSLLICNAFSAFRYDSEHLNGSALGFACKALDSQSLATCVMRKSYS
uniref:Uncharacterized protein n=1 Tax=Glossina pallidipes TaxID=7398 RepID=A0A1A9ZFR6_GLOPL